MKLNKMQLDALAKSITEEVSKENQKFNDVIYKQKRIIKGELLVNSSNDLIKYLTWAKGDGGKFFEDTYPEKFEHLPKIKRTDEYNLREEVSTQIILKSIEIDNLEEIIEKIKEKLTA